jgi:hypothetical protein
MKEMLMGVRVDGRECLSDTEQWGAAIHSAQLSTSEYRFILLLYYSVENRTERTHDPRNVEKQEKQLVECDNQLEMETSLVLHTPAAYEKAPPRARGRYEATSSNSMNGLSKSVTCCAVDLPFDRQYFVVKSGELIMRRRFS